MDQRKHHLINGIDMQARMREMRENMIKTLPPEQRALAEDMLGSEGQVGERQCITAEAAQTMADPDALLADARENMPNCDLKVEQSGGDALQFSGHCNDPDGFTATSVAASRLYPAARCAPPSTATAATPCRPGCWARTLAPAMAK
ncbi:DUF3617 family protein [Halopseudomonas pachastrellae]|nr:DUF3617 family protein [Halopseudomonas pachastrellae]